jgi:hypothetical protein
MKKKGLGESYTTPVLSFMKELSLILTGQIESPSVWEAVTIMELSKVQLLLTKSCHWSCGGTRDLLFDQEF